MISNGTETPDAYVRGVGERGRAATIKTSGSCPQIAEMTLARRISSPNSANSPFRPLFRGSVAATPRAARRASSPRRNVYVHTTPAFSFVKITRERVLRRKESALPPSAVIVIALIARRGCAEGTRLLDDIGSFCDKVRHVCLLLANAQ